MSQIEKNRKIKITNFLKEKQNVSIKNKKTTITNLRKYEDEN